MNVGLAAVEPRNGVPRVGRVQACRRLTQGVKEVGDVRRLRRPVPVGRDVLVYGSGAQEDVRTYECKSRESPDRLWAGKSRERRQQSPSRQRRRAHSQPVLPQKHPKDLQIVARMDRSFASDVAQPSAAAVDAAVATAPGGADPASSVSASSGSGSSRSSSPEAAAVSKTGIAVGRRCGPVPDGGENA